MSFRGAPDPNWIEIIHQRSEAAHAGNIAVDSAMFALGFLPKDHANLAMFKSAYLISLDQLVYCPIKKSIFELRASMFACYSWTGHTINSKSDMDVDELIKSAFEIYEQMRQGGNRTKSKMEFQEELI